MTMAERLAALLEVYPVPEELESEEQFHRFHGFDIGDRTGEDLMRELTVLRFINYFCDSEWHLEREVAVSKALAARGRKK